MTLTKQDKIKFVENGKKQLAKYKVIGIIPLSSVPDKLFQSSRNALKPGSQFIMGRKTLLVKILESGEHTKPLAKDLTGTSAIMLSNDDPFELYGKFKSNKIKLAAKPKQIAPDDINIEAGDTNIQPGQAVTELKMAGIDVQIQKGKVIIAKDKVLVKRGTQISPAVAKALKTLDIMPFSAMITPSVILEGKLRFTAEILSIDAVQTTSNISKAFNTALTLSMKAGIVNAYTVRTLVAQAYRAAMAVGLAGNVPESGIVEILLGNASMAAKSLDGMVKPEAPAAPETK